MRALRFFGINVAWFASCFAVFFFLDKSERGGAFIWQAWHLYAAMVATVVSAFFIARLHHQLKPERGPISLNQVGCFVALIINALLAFSAYVVISIFIYGE